MRGFSDGIQLRKYLLPDSIRREEVCTRGLISYPQRLVSKKYAHGSIVTHVRTPEIQTSEVTFYAIPYIGDRLGQRDTRLLQVTVKELRDELGIYIQTPPKTVLLESILKVVEIAVVY
jgi:hypothetical protein